jgi:hypothetical protein
MEMLTTLLIGAVLGGLLVVGVIFAMCVVKTKEDWKEHEEIRRGMRMRVYTLEAENARLRVSLAVGEMTEEGKKVATMTMAALDAVIAAAKTARLGECDQRGVVDRQGDVPQ